MNIKLLTEHHLEFLSLHFVNEAAHAGMSLHFSKYHSVRNHMSRLKWPMTWDLQHCGMCDQLSLRYACAYAQSDQSLCQSLEYSMNIKLLTEHHLEFLSLHLVKGGCTCWYESTLSKYHIVRNYMTFFCRGSNEPWQEISNSMVCATRKALDQPAHTRSLIIAFASRWSILWILSYCRKIIWNFLVYVF